VVSNDPADDVILGIPPRRDNERYEDWVKRMVIVKFKKEPS